MRIISRAFSRSDFVAGNDALNFVNTATAWDQREPVDWLDSFGRLVEWAELGRVVSTLEASKLLSAASDSPAAADAALDHARSLRGVVQSVFHDIISSKPASRLGQLEGIWKEVVGRSHLKQLAVGGAIEADLSTSKLNVIGDRIALSAVELLQHFPRERTRICAGTHCGWQFIDTSKGGRRRWCDMATCGNAAKSQRHYSRRQQAG